VSIRGVIFDCDGVLFTSHQANLAYYNTVLDKFSRPPVTDPVSPAAHLCHTAASPVVFAELLAGEDQDQVLAYAATLDYRQFLHYMIPEPGMVAALDQLSQRLPLAVATNRGTSMVEILRHFELTSFFSVVVTSHDVPRPKPYPDMLEKAADQLGLAACELLFVGDSELDQMAAQQAGIPFVAYKSVLPGSRRVEHYQELQLLVQELNSGT